MLSPLVFLHFFIIFINILCRIFEKKENDAANTIKMDLYANNGNGDHLCFRVNIFETAADIKSRVNEKMGLPTDKPMVMVFGGEQLNDENNMVKCRIGKNSTFMFVHRDGESSA